MSSQRFVAKNAAGTADVFSVGNSTVNINAVNTSPILVVDCADPNVTFHSPVEINNTLDISSVLTTENATVNENLFVGQNLLLANTSDSISISEAAMVASGGVSIAKRLRVGESIIAQGGIDMNSQFIRNVPIPTSSDHAASKEYVDNAIQGLDIKDSCLVATTGPLDLSLMVSGTSIDNIVLTSNTRVLVKDQTDPIENGIYIVQTAQSPERALDFNIGNNVAGAYIFVESGLQNGGNGFVCTSISPNDIVGTNLITFVQFSGAGQINAGNALSKSGNRLDVNVDNSSIEIASDTLRISSNAIGTGLSGGSGAVIQVTSDQSHVTRIGVITHGTWNADTISVEHGGTGASTLPVNQVLVGNGTNAIQSFSNLTFNGSELSTRSANVNTQLRFGTSPIEGAQIQNGQTINVPNRSIVFSGLEPFSTINAWSNVNISGSSLDSSTNGISITRASTLELSPPSDGSNITFQARYALVSHGDILVLSTQDSTNSSSGSIVTHGGLGVGGALNVADSISTESGNIVLNNTATNQGVIQGPSPNFAIYFQTNAANAPDKLGFYSFADIDFNTGGLLNAQQTRFRIDANGRTTFFNTAPAVSSTNAAIRILGGLFVQENILSQGPVTINSTNAESLHVKGGSLTEGNIVTLSSVSTLFTGNTNSGHTGLSIAGNDTLHEAIVFSNTSSNSSFTFQIGGSQNVSPLGSGNLGIYTSQLAIRIQNSTGDMQIYSTTDSASISTGAFVVSGGVAVAKNVHIGETLFVNHITFGPSFIHASGNALSVSSPNLGMESETMSLTTTSLNVISNNTEITSPVSVNGRMSVTPSQSISNFVGNAIDIPTSTIESNSQTSSLASNSTVTIGAQTINSGSSLTIANAATLHIRGPVHAGTNVSITNPWALRISSGRMVIEDTTDATSVNSGALILHGGMSVAKSLFVNNLVVNSTTNTFGHIQFGFNTNDNVATIDHTSGQGIRVSNAMSVLGNTIHISHTDDTNAMTIDGGMTVNKNFVLGGRFQTNPTFDYRNNTPSVVIHPQSTFQNLGTGSLLLNVYQGNGSTVLPTFSSSRHILQTTTSSLTYNSPTWPNNITDNFICVFQGYIWSQFANEFAFLVTCTDAFQLFIDNQEIASSNVTNTTSTLYSGQYTFENANSFVRFTLIWYTGTTSNKQMRVEWLSAQQARQDVPASAFAHSAHHNHNHNLEVDGPSNFYQNVVIHNSHSNSALSITGGATIGGNVNLDGQLTVGNYYMQANNNEFVISRPLLNIPTTIHQIGQSNQSNVYMFSNPSNSNLQIGWYQALNSFVLMSETTGSGLLKPLQIRVSEDQGALIANTDDTFSLSCTSDSSDPNTGAFTIHGGLGVAKNVNIAQNLAAQSISTSNLAVSPDMHLQSAIPIIPQVAVQNDLAMFSSDPTFPTAHFVNINHNNIVHYYDGYFDNNVEKSSSASGTFKMTKANGQLTWSGSGAGHSPGSEIPTWTNILQLSTNSVTARHLISEIGVGIVPQIGSNATLSLFDTPNKDNVWTIRHVSSEFDISYNDNQSISISNSGSTTIHSTQDAVSSTGGGALTILGGVGIAKSVFIGGNLDIDGLFTPMTMYIQSTQDAVSNSENGSGSFFSYGGGAFSKTLFANTLVANNHVQFYGSSPNINFGSTSQSGPAQSVRSAGTKIVFYPNISETSVDFATGVSSSALWHSVPTSTNSFEWYANTDRVFEIQGSGQVIAQRNVHIQNSNSGIGGLQLSPVNANDSTFIAFHKSNDLNDASSAGDIWRIGKGTWQSPPSSFAIGCNSTGAVATFASNGQVTFNSTSDSAVQISGGLSVTKNVSFHGETTLLNSSYVVLHKMSNIQFRDNTTDHTILRINSDSNSTELLAIPTQNVSLNAGNSGDTLVNFENNGSFKVYHSTSERLVIGTVSTFFGDLNVNNGKVNISSNAADAFVTNGGIQSNSLSTTNVNCDQLTIATESTISVDSNVLTLTSTRPLTVNAGPTTISNTSDSALNVSGGAIFEKSIQVQGNTSINNNSFFEIDNSSTDRHWTYLGKIQTASGGMVYLKVDMLEVTLHIQSNNVNVQFHSFNLPVSSPNIVLFETPENDHHLFIHALPLSKTSVHTLMNTTNSVFNPNSEGTGSVPNGSHSNFQVGWTEAFNTSTAMPQSLLSLGSISISDTANSNSASSGALRIAGGASISKNIYIGGTTYTNTVDAADTLTLSTNGNSILTIGSSNCTFSNSIFPSSPTQDIGSPTASWANVHTGNLILYNTTNSSSLSSGSFVTPGGIAVAKDIWTNGTIYIGNNFSISNSTISSSDLTISGNVTVQRHLDIAQGRISGQGSNQQGQFMTIQSSIWQDSVTNSGTTASNPVHSVWIGQPIIAALSANVATPIASTLFIQGAPIAGTNQTLQQAYAAYIDSGKVFVGDTSNATSHVAQSSGASLIVAGGMSVEKSANVGQLVLGHAATNGVKQSQIFNSGGQNGLMTFKVTTTNPNDTFQFVHSNVSDTTVLSMSRTHSYMTSSLEIQNSLSVNGTFQTDSNATLLGKLLVGNGVDHPTPSTIATILNSVSIVPSSNTTTLALYSDTNHFSLGNHNGTFRIQQDASNVISMSTGGVTVYSTNDYALSVHGGLSVGKRTEISGHLLVDPDSTSATANALGATFVCTIPTISPNTQSTSSTRHIAIVNPVNGGTALSMISPNNIWDLTTESGFGITQNGKTHFTIDGPDGIMTIASTTNSSSTNNGALIVRGGASFSKNTFFGGNMTLDKSTDGANTIAIRNSNSSALASCQFTLQNDQSTPSVLALYSSNHNSHSNCTVLQSGISSLKLLNSSGNGLVLNSTLTLANEIPFSILNTTEATNVSTGALQIQGGVSVNKNIYCDSSVLLKSASSSYTGIRGSSSAIETYTLTLPVSRPPVAGATLICDLSGNLNWGIAMPEAGNPSGRITQSFNGANNQSSPQNVNGLVFESGSFAIFVNVYITATTNATTMYELRGIRNGPSWNFIQNHIGDNVGIVFSITNSGQVQYTSPNISGFESLVFQWEEAINSESTINTINIGTDLFADPSVSLLNVVDTTFTDSMSLPNATVPMWNAVKLFSSELAAIHPITTSAASTLYIEGPPRAGTNQTITNRYALHAGAGQVLIADTAQSTSTSSGALQVRGGASVSKNVNVGGTVTANGINVGGQTHEYILSGQHLIGASASQLVQVDIVFSSPLPSSTYTVTGNVSTTSVSSNVFVVSFSSVSNSGFTANVFMINGSSWNDNNTTLNWNVQL